MENKNQKLLFFAPYYSPHIGGVENYTQELTEQLAKKDFDITIFTSHLPLASPDKENFPNIKIIRFPAFEIVSNYPLPKFWLPGFWSLFVALFKNDFRVVISQTRFFNTSLLALAYAKVKKSKWIHIEHGSDFINVSSGLTNKIAKFYDLLIGSAIFKLSNINIAISEAVKSFVNKFDKRNVPVIYRGLNFSEIDEAVPNQKLREKYPDKLIIAFTGRLYKWKGVENSIKAVINLPKKTKDKVVFIIAGDGEDFENLRSIKDDSIVMLGPVTRKEVFGIQKIADIYIHSAFPGGGLATSLLEAMYCKCAIIATPNEGAMEVIQNEKNGILITESDSNMIKAAIENLIPDKNKMTSYGNEASEFIQNNFSWENSINQFKEIIEK